MRARLATSSIHSVTARPCSAASWRASRQQTPRVAEVVDDAAEDVPAQRRGHGSESAAAIARRLAHPCIIASAGAARIIAIRDAVTDRRPWPTTSRSTSFRTWCARGATSASAGSRPRLRGCREADAARRAPSPLASVPAESRPAARGHRSRKTYLEDKFGGPERAAQIYARVAAAGATVGIPFAFDAHRAPAQHARRASADRVGAGAAATPSDAGRAAVPRVFHRRAVRRRPRRAGGDRGRGGLRLPTTRARLLDSDEGTDAIALMDRRAREIGVQGVPFFIFNRKSPCRARRSPNVCSTRSRRRAPARRYRRESTARQTDGPRRADQRVPAQYREHDGQADDVRPELVEHQHEAGERQRDLGEPRQRRAEIADVRRRQRDDADDAAERRGQERAPREVDEQQRGRVDEHERHQRLAHRQAERGEPGAHRLRAGDARRGIGGQRDRRRHVGEHAVIEDEEVRREQRHAERAPAPARRSTPG